MTVDISDIENIIARQNQWRQTQTINLIASENTPSEAVRRVQLSDFMGRYAEALAVQIPMIITKSDLAWNVRS